MNFEKDQILTLENNLEYLVVDIVNYNNNQYLYLVRMDEDKFNIVKVINENGIIGLGKLSDEEYYNVLELLHKQNQ
ncbi:MAG: hypothetical protein E7165_00210 [Firmicutes bacterium]|nr:hypothetical protein [Bacillota bacterium]